MTNSDKKFLAIMPKLNSGRVDMLLEDKRLKGKPDWE